MPLLLIFSVLSQPPAPEPTVFVEDFESLRADLWSFSTGDPGKAAFDQGRLILDLSSPRKGKWAYADLYQAFTLPARVEWDQCLAHDSPHTWFAGIQVLSLSQGVRESLEAGLGGTGLHNCAFLDLGRGEEDQVQPQRWYHLVLELDTTRQVLTVAPRDADQPVARLETMKGLVHAPFFLRFFQNDSRLGPDLPDEYDQDRGTTWVDNLRITSASIEHRTPPPPGTTYPYRIPVVFNRATRWLTPADGLTRGCIAYEEARWLALTGRRCVSTWLRLQRWVTGRIPEAPADPSIADADDETTLFHLPDGAAKATFALRALQWDLEQHPVLRWQGTPQGLSWRLRLTATDGVRPFFWSLAQTDATAQPSQGSINVLEAYRSSGRPNRHAEVDFLVELSALDPDTPAARPSLRLRLGMPGRPSVAPCAPVVANLQDARDHGLPLEAVVLDEAGRILAAPAARLEARLGDRRIPLDAIGDRGLRRAILRDLPPGEHLARLEATDPTGTPLAACQLPVTVTPLDFASHYHRQARSYCTRDGQALGPLLGDLFAWVLYSDLTLTSRHLVLGLASHQELTAQGKQIAYTKWRSLPRGDLDRYLAYMADSGVRVIRITPNVSVAEYYSDAGGHLAMHGFEQLSYILDAARRHGIRAIINLFHYPYLFPGTGNNPPVAQYFEAGYRRDFDWTSDQMWQYLAAYLEQFVGFTGTDPAVLAYTVMGENDQSLPEAWINRAHDVIKRHAPNQMVVLEQGGSIFNCRDADPASYAGYKPIADGGIGFRTYETYRYPTDCFMAVAARFFDLAPPSFWGEVSCGINVWPQFIVKLRDALGLTLTLQQTMAISWSAPPLEGERRVFTQAAGLVDWTTFRRARPPVALIVDRPDREQVKRLVAYEDALSSIPADYEFIRPGTPQGGYAVVFDARQDQVPGDIAGRVRAALREPLPLTPSDGNHCSYALSADRRWLVAHLRNATRYEVLPCDVGRTIELCRMADRERPLHLDLQGFPGASKYAAWEAHERGTLRQGTFQGATTLDFGTTAADLLVVVTPAHHPWPQADTRE